MNCWHCGTELIWGGDHDGEEGDEHDIVTNLSCPNCETYVYVYHTFNFPTMKKQMELFDKEPEMWYHYCDEEKSDMEIGKGEDCSWCGANESSS